MSLQFHGVRIHDGCSAGIAAWTAESSHLGTSKHSTGDGRKLLKPQSLTLTPSPTRPHFPILPKQFHLLGTKPSNIWACGRQSHLHCHMCLCEGPCAGMATWMMVPAETRGVGFPWSKSFRQLWTFICRYWELNSGPLQEQYTLLTTKPSLQPVQAI